MRNNRLVFGTAGVPLSAKGRDPLSGVEAVAQLGLSAMELEFVHGVRIREEMASRVRQRAEELGVLLTCHGPYYINLGSEEKDKQKASVKRIIDTARAAHLLGARSITFHAAFYMKQSPATIHDKVKSALVQILDILDKENNQVQIRPEVTGKPTQYGDLEELLLLSSQLPGVFPCVDFSHMHARTGGANNSLTEFKTAIERYGQILGKEAIKDMHIHISGIAYGQKGEKKHLVLKESDLRWRELLTALKEAKAGGVVICESPNLEEDALLLVRTYDAQPTKGINGF